MENDPKRFILTMKGAPEIIIARCTTIVGMIFIIDFIVEEEKEKEVEGK